MTTQTKLITAEELLAMPRGYGYRYELIRGAVIPSPASVEPVARAITYAAYSIAKYVEAHQYGYPTIGVGFWLERDPDTVRSADVAWTAPGRTPKGAQGYPEIAPDLAVDVKAPNNSNPEMAAKAQMWLCYGSQIALVLDPATVTVRIYRPNSEPVTLGEDDVLDLGDLLPGFSTPVWRLFRRQRHSPPP